MQTHNPSSPISASSPTLIATPLPGSKAMSLLRERCAPLSLGLQPPGKGFIQPHHSNLPRRHVRRVPSPPKVISEAEKLQALRRRWAHTACLQEIGSNSGIFVAFSPEQQHAVTCSMEYTDSGRLSSLLTSKNTVPCPSSNEEERPTSSGTTPSSSAESAQAHPPKSPSSTSEIDPSLLAEFAAIVRIHTAPPTSSSSSLVAHDIIVSSEVKDDGTPHLTEAQLTDTCAFLRSTTSSSPLAPPPDRPHPRHGTRAPTQPQPKVLVLAPRTLAADALALAACWSCLSGMRLPSIEADEEVDVDILSGDDVDTLSEEIEAPLSSDEGRETPVHALLMRLHDLEPGLKDEWRGLLSRSGMDVIGAWVAHC